ncbi:MAG: orotidine-5'-phosphate decarboxylase [Gammaproteobacteria bacterium]|nr:orotidine-5'-phosphate decarboxylase [Gammaproteobacteria bacterium]
MLIPDPKVIVALDMVDCTTVYRFVDRLDPGSCRLKVGKELFTAAGPQLVDQLCNKGYEIFLDLKFHDIPNTVKKAVYAASKLGIWMLNVHASGGSEMLSAAREGIDMAGVNRPFLIAVSVLTSMSDNSLRETGISCSVADQVNRLTKLALTTGLDGMVCSAQEAVTLRQNFGDTPILVTPGIRPEGSQQDDQRRIMTPREAMDAGASYLVIGRPITQHPDPSAGLDDINQSLV